ncbi:MAG: hypothetical protein ACTSV2_18665, partial [Candidatus Thorarchaeota archaeon]
MSVSNQEIKRKSSRFRPEIKSLDGNSSDLLRAAIVGAMLMLFLLPLLNGNQLSHNFPTSIEIEETGTTAAGGPDNLLYVGLPGMYTVTPGNTLGMNGFAYVNTAEESVYFVDPLSETTVNMSLPSSLSFGSQLLAVDVDNNGDIEFIGIRRVTSMVGAVYIVDFDADTYTEHTFNSVATLFYGTGNFNGDTILDVALHVNGSTLFILDLATGSSLGSFDPMGTLRGYYSAIGQFTGSSTDQIAITNDTHVFIMNGDGTEALNVTVSGTARGIDLFNYGGGFADIIVFDNLGYVTAHQGTDLSVIFSTQVGPVSSASYGVTGNFTGDAQEDIYIQSNGWTTGLFLDGTNGTIIRETPNTVGYGIRLDVGNIDDELLSDIVTETDLGNPCFVHGATGEIAYTETLIENPSQIFAYDVNSDSRDDIFIRSDNDLYILLSEFDPPVIHPEPIDPIHPTVV